MSKLKNEIKEDLLNQLENNGTYGRHYVELVDDYMSMWEIKNKLLKDIDERGVSVEYIHGAGQRGFKKNDSVPEFIRTNAQMLKLLSELGLKPSPKEVDSDGDY